MKNSEFEQKNNYNFPILTNPLPSLDDSKNYITLWEKLESYNKLPKLVGNMIISVCAAKEASKLLNKNIEDITAKDLLEFLEKLYA